MSVPSWNFLLTDLQGNVLGDLSQATNRMVALPLVALPTASFQITMQHPLAPYLCDPTWDGLLKCYRNNVLRFHGPILSGAEAFDANSQTVAGNAVGAFWKLQFRLLGTDSNGWALGTDSTPQDLSYIASQMIAAANAAGYTGIDNGTITASMNGAAGTYFFKQVDQAITELSSGLNTFEWEVAPIEPVPSGHAFPRIGLFNAVPLIGSTKTNAIFEFGTTKANVASFGRITSRDALATDGFIQQPASADHSNILRYTDAAAEATRGKYQALIDDGGTQWDVLRSALVQENVAIRKQAKQVVTFVPMQNTSPAPFDDYIVGDQVRLRVNVNAINVLDAMLRIWGISFAIDDLGNETPTLTLIP